MCSKIIRICGAFLAIFLLTGGGSCAFVATSGGSSSGEEEERPNFVLIIGDEQLVNTPVEGVQFVTGAATGVTGPDGNLTVKSGSRTRFFIGEIPLGNAVSAKAVMTPLDLVSETDIDAPAVINIVRLLLSLDADPGDERITIPASLRMRATRANPSVAGVIDGLDFADDAMFNNAASQLVASLTEDYAFTAVLVDADTARRQLGGAAKRGPGQP